jgi:tetratricopeptide (TPR) repeat protein/predicted Ser/Thr protein kinase
MKHETAVPIGSGGMGEVFKAWDPDLQRHVALKYLKHDDPVLVERLLREARAQARVDHPSVGKVYEVGEDDGRPFIAMEFVDGVPLDVAAAGLSVEQKVLLVKQVADAVQAAHTAGLIHRDLKPANILVADRDGRPHPFVLDFGIARLEEVAGLTMTGQVMGTPGYLSPEQARGEVATLDRRTDVFSLGVVLYELLGGARPFSGDSNVEILMRLIEDEPEPLRKIVPRLPKDLETVVMTCLEKDPDRRYPSAKALADDLGRFLAGDPVEARPIGARERLVRRARKNPVATSALAAALVALAALLVVSVGGWIKYTEDLRRERNAAVTARAEAERNAREATEVTDFLVSVFSISDPEVGAGEIVTARELLDTGADRVRSRFEDQPLVQARLMRTLGSIYRKLAMHAESEQLLRDSVEVYESSEATDPGGLASSLDELGVLYAVQGRFAEAEPLFKQSLTIGEEQNGPDSGALLGNLDKLGNLYAIIGRYDEAEPLFRKALAIRERTLGPDDLSLSATLDNLGILLMREGRYDEAEKVTLRSIELKERAFGPDHPRLTQTINNLGTIFDEQGRFAEAEATFRRSLTIGEKAYGPDHPIVAMILANLAAAVMHQGRFSEAEPLILGAITIRKKALGPAHSDVGISINTLGNLYRQTGRLDEAEAALLESQEIWEKSLGPDHPNLAYGCNNLGELRLDQHRYAEASALFERALAIAEANMVPDHPEAITAREGLAAAYRAMGREEDAAAVEVRSD